MELSTHEIQSLLNTKILPSLGWSPNNSFLPKNLVVNSFSIEPTTKKLSIWITISADPKVKRLNMISHYEKMIEKMLKNFLVDYEIDIIFL